MQVVLGKVRVLKQRRVVWDIRLFVFEVVFQYRSFRRTCQGKKEAQAANVAGGRRGLFSRRSIHKIPDAFMDGRIFSREVIVILIVRVKQLQLAIRERNGAGQMIPDPLQLKGAAGRRPFNRNLNRAFVYKRQERLRIAENIAYSSG